MTAEPNGLRAWFCRRCGAWRDYRVGDSLRYYRNGAPCPVDARHGYMALMQRDAW